MASTTQSVVMTDVLGQPSTILGRGLLATPVHIRKFSANSTDQTALGTFVGTINNIFMVMPLDWFDCIHSIKLINDAMDTNGSPTLTVDVGVGYITPAANMGSTAATLTVSAAAVYGSAVTTFQGANANGGTEILVANSSTAFRASTGLGFGAGETPGTPARVLDDAGLTIPPPGSMPVLLLKAHAAAATAASAPKCAILVTFTR